MKEILFTEVSGNKKTGPIPVSGSVAATCPPACPFSPKDGKPNGCYAAYGPSMIHWGRLNNGGAGVTWSEFLTRVRKLWRQTLWRHNQFGDLRGAGNEVDAASLVELTAANVGKCGFTYTHKPVLTRQGKFAKANRAAIAAANRGGFTVNLSGNNAAHADELKELGIGPVVSVVPAGTANTSFTPKGNKIVICPAIYREGVTCQRCGLCQKVNRSVIIGFLAHGAGAKHVEAYTSKATAGAVAA
jgi:hypothetical protein